MADPAGITGTTLAIASLLYSTCRTICDVIDSYKKAPKEYTDMAEDLRALEGSLSSLQLTLQDTSDASLSPEQLESLKELDLPLTNCNTACEDFGNKLASMTSRSSKDHTSFWDRFRLHFNKSDVMFLRNKLGAAKGTIQVALGIVTLTMFAQHQTKFDSFQETTASTMSEFSGMIEALTLAINSLSVSGVSSDPQGVQTVAQKLNEYGQMLKQCLLFCATAMDAVHASAPGTQVKHAKALDHARQIIGNLGPIMSDAPTIAVDKAEVKGNAFQIIGNVDLAGVSKEGLDFLAGR